MMALELGRTDIAEKLLKLGASAAFKNKVRMCWNLWVELEREVSHFAPLWLGQGGGRGGGGMESLS